MTEGAMKDNLFSVDTPPVDAQVKYWDFWNLESRVGDLDFHCVCIRDEALKCARELEPCRHILEVGCGTGWLSDSLASIGPTIGVDLSPKAIAHAKTRGAGATYLCGDFIDLDLPGPFDLIVSADSISHVPDQRAFVDRCADLLRPGGRLVLMTQNGFIYRRSSWVEPPADGQIRRWPTREELRKLLRERFTVEYTTTVAPFTGNLGVMRFANSGVVRGIARRVLGLDGVVRLYSRLGLGAELVVVARRR